MGDHDSWYTLLMPEFWHALEHNAAEHLARDWQFMMFGATHFTLIHVAGAVVAFLFAIFLALRYRAGLGDETRGVVPQRRFGLASMTDRFVGAVFNLSADVMGEEDAKRYLPLTGTLASLNTFLDTASNIQYLHATANLNGNDADNISVIVNDNGNTGAGGGGNDRGGRWQRQHALQPGGGDIAEGWLLYPNPAADWVRLHHPSLAAGTHVRLELFDLEGQHKFTREATVPVDGPFEIPLQLRSLASGVYFCRIEVEGEAGSRHLLRRLGVLR